jgi:hypothetical protein
MSHISEVVCDVDVVYWVQVLRFLFGDSIGSNFRALDPHLPRLYSFQFEAALWRNLGVKFAVSASRAIRSGVLKILS